MLERFIRALERFIRVLERFIGVLDWRNFERGEASIRIETSNTRPISCVPVDFCWFCGSHSSRCRIMLAAVVRVTVPGD